MNYEKSMLLRARKGDLYIKDKTYIVYKDKDKKDDLLNVLPGKLQADFRWHAKDSDIEFHTFR